MTAVCFAGVTGWTAPPLLKALEAADDLRLASGVSRSAAGGTLREATGLENDGPILGSVAEALAAASVDVLVDFTSAEAVRGNVWTTVSRSMRNARCSRSSKTRVSWR